MYMHEVYYVVYEVYKVHIWHRDCNDGGRYYIFETPPKKRCVTTCAAVSMCGEVQVPPEHLKVCQKE